MGPRLSRARSRAAEAPWSCSRGGGSCRSAARASGRDRPASRRSTRPRQHRGRARHAAASPASSSGVSRRGGRPLGRSHSPAKPSALQPTTASRSARRSMAASRAASARLSPSSAPAIACIRAAARPSSSRPAARRKPSADRSPPILSVSPVSAHDHPPHPCKNRTTQRSSTEPPESGHGLDGIRGGLRPSGHPCIRAAQGGYVPVESRILDLGRHGSVHVVPFEEFLSPEALGERMTGWGRRCGFRIGEGDEAHRTVTIGDDEGVETSCDGLLGFGPVGRMESGSARSTGSARLTPTPPSCPSSPATSRPGVGSWIGRR